MSSIPETVFDPKVFLATVGAGRSITCWNKDQVIFSQGDPADALFYIQKGKVKVTTLSSQGKEVSKYDSLPLSNKAQQPRPDYQIRYSSVTACQWRSRA